jgi:hypothetical protein
LSAEDLFLFKKHTPFKKYVCVTLGNFGKSLNEAILESKMALLCTNPLHLDTSMTTDILHKATVLHRPQPKV